MKIKSIVVALLLSAGLLLFAAPKDAEAMVRARCFDHVHAGFVCFHFEDGVLLAISYDWGSIIF